jgi:hypothetical protein
VSIGVFIAPLLSYQFSYFQHSASLYLPLLSACQSCQALICLKRIYHFWWSMLVLTTFA